MYYIKIKCQRTVGQCHACPKGRAVAGLKSTNVPPVYRHNSTLATVGPVKETFLGGTDGAPTIYRPKVQ